MSERAKSMTHPLDGFDIQAVNIKCFDENGSGFFRFSPISIVIGKNNSGKSTVVDLLDIAINQQNSPTVRPSQRRGNSEASIDIVAPLSNAALERNFSNTSSGGGIPGRHGEFARKFIGIPAEWRYRTKKAAQLLRLHISQPDWDHMPDVAKTKFSQCAEWTLANRTLLRVAAERSVGPEGRNPPTPSPDGKGITNLIRHFINSDSQPRDVVEVDLLRDLNTIYSGDCHFEAIMCQENDETNLWEIFLREEGKGDIRLSESGSSLQSVFIILSYFRLVPLLNNTNWTSLILAVEEPENNLHPALLRRLISFLATQRDSLGFSLVMTTHSPICIDWATSRKDAGILHVTRDGSRSTCTNVLDYDGRTGILDDLDVRGSDILQANGVIWVEGPSDRVYLRRWIDLLTEGELVEGSHYSFMYYGGKILSHFEAVPPTEVSTLVSMVTLNRNVAIVIDSDRKWKKGSTRKPPMRLNTTKTRLRQEIAERGGFSWVTAGKEIENYIPLKVWQRLLGEDFQLKHEFEDIPNKPEAKALKSTKVALAHEVVEQLQREDLEEHLDLTSRTKELIDNIRKWNALG